MSRNLEVYTWFERDRALVEVRDEDTNQTVMEWWDDHYVEAVQDGYLDPRNLRRSALEYVVQFGL